MKPAARGPMKRYSIHLRGWDPVVYEGHSASAARYRCFLSWRDAVGHLGSSTFKDFLDRVETTLHLGKAETK